MKRVILLLALMFSLFAAHAQVNIPRQELRYNCLLYTSDAADDDAVV